MNLNQTFLFKKIFVYLSSRYLDNIKNADKPVGGDGGLNSSNLQ